MVLILAFLLPFQALLAAQSEKQHLVTPFFGEKNFDLYDGPLDPMFRKDERLGRVVFDSSERMQRHFFDATQPLLWDLSEDFKDLEVGLACPNGELAENFQYIRYLYRLSALSYLEENLRFMDESAKKLRFENVCEADPKKLLEKCVPQGEDMKLFVKSAKVLSRNFEPFSPAYNFDFSAYKDGWIKDFRKEMLNDPAKIRLSSSCGKGGCSNIQESKLRESFKRACEEDSALFAKICSEKDELYGISKVNQAFHAISSSDAMKVIDKNGHGRGCLARFAHQMKDREVRSKELERTLAAIYEKLRKDGVQVSGRFFPAGSLRRFIEDGLANIFVEPKKPKEIAKTEVKPIEQPVELAPLAPEPLKQIFRPKPKKKIVKVEKPKEKPAPVKSHFLRSALARKEFALDSIRLDMLKFGYDYVFSSKMLSFMDTQMQKYTTRKGLEEMRDYDNLGSAKGPVPLLFLKYLIEKERHQALFTLLDVLGEEFYVQNNIDDASLVKAPDYVRLSFEENSDHLWQISILKENEN